MGTWLRRIVLFVLTNLLVVFLLAVVLRVLGVDAMLYQSQAGINVQGLLVLSVVMGFGGSLISLALSKTIARWATGAQVIDQPRNQMEAWLLSVVQRLARQSSIGMPDVAIYPSPDVNAFATGARRDHALVAVSVGLLNTMPEKEIEAVLAHELSHVANGDMITMTLLQGVLNTFVIFLSRVVGFVVDKAVLRSEGRRVGPGYWLTVMLAQVVLGILASLVVMAYSRHREYKADAGAARMVGPNAMIGALETLRSVHEPAALPQSLKAFGIRGGGMALFASHPPLEKRIEALRRLGGTVA